MILSLLQRVSMLWAKRNILDSANSGDVFPSVGKHRKPGLTGQGTEEVRTSGNLGISRGALLSSQL